MNMQARLAGDAVRLPRVARPVVDSDEMARSLAQLRLDMRAMQQEVLTLRKAYAGIKGAREKLRYRVSELERLLEVRRGDDGLRVVSEVKPFLAGLLQLVAQVSGVEVAVLCGARTNRLLTAPRAVFCAVARRNGFTLHDIGGALGGRHHTSAHYLAERGEVFLMDQPDVWGACNVTR